MPFGRRVRGRNNSVYTFGSVTVTDPNTANPDVGGYFVDNDGVSDPAHHGRFHGAVTVTTAGGTSAPFSRAASASLASDGRQRHAGRSGEGLGQSGPER